MGNEGLNADLSQKKKRLVEDSREIVALIWSIFELGIVMLMFV